VPPQPPRNRKVKMQSVFVLPSCIVIRSRQTLGLLYPVGCQRVASSSSGSSRRVTEVLEADRHLLASPCWLFLQLRLQQMHEDTHLAMLELDVQVLDVPWVWKHTYYFRCTAPRPDSSRQDSSSAGLYLQLVLAPTTVCPGSTWNTFCSPLLAGMLLLRHGVCLSHTVLRQTKLHCLSHL
jgi:hypothetical protein